MVAYTDLPNATYIPAEYNTTVIEYANETRTDCEVYADGTDYQIDTNGTFYTSNCDLVAETFSIDLETLEYWNPSLNTSDSACAVVSGLYYCVLQSGNFPTAVATTDAAAPTATGTTSNCSEYMEVLHDMTCEDILVGAGITLAEFYAWNPEVGSDCSDLQLSMYHPRSE